MASYKSPAPIPLLHPIILALTIAIALTSYLAAMYASRATAILLASVPFLASRVAAEDVDVGWYPPSRSEVNDLDSAVNAEGVYGFIFDSSDTPDEKYGTYNWCNMPHARKREYVRAPEEYELQYVELVSIQSRTIHGWGLSLPRTRPAPPPPLLYVSRHRHPDALTI